RTTFKVGTDAAFAPFESVASNGTIEGFDIDVIQEVARRNGWTLTIENRGFDTLIPSLQSGDIDIAISAMSINENRSRIVDFSTPYYEANQSVMQRAIDVTNNYTKLDDLRGKNLRFGAQGGTVAVDIIEAEFVSKNDGTLKRYDTYPLALQALKTNEVDVVMMDAPAQREAARSDPLVKFAFEFSTGDIYGIAVKKGDDATLAKINDALEAMADDGTMAALREKWGV
ncbi:MAG TPA: transporter substrate-binding domain-containing protein, partial [Candidatus Thermoplasmatota archaeon]|nr:transporter substrate-binding domain-containing protein [Candidatus Thermoplasmatota archaeon]